MRYLVQLLIPALIIIGVIYIAVRSRRSGTNSEQNTGEKAGDTGTFILILVIGALVATGVVFALFGETSL